jgi:hypothetical protein
MGGLVSDVMVETPLAISSSATLLAAAQMMRDADIGDLLVLNHTSLIGIVTDRDLVVRASSRAGSIQFDRTKRELTRCDGEPLGLRGLRVGADTPACCSTVARPCSREAGWDRLARRPRCHGGSRLRARCHLCCTARPLKPGN